MDVRKFFYNLFSGRWFFCERLFFPSRFLFFKYVTWRFSPCGRIYFFFCLDTKEEVTRRKNQGWTSPGLLRKGRSGAVKPNSLRFTTLRQGFPTPPVHSSAHAPPPRPVFISNGFFIRQGASLLAFCFWLRLWLSLYDFWGKICIHTPVRDKNSS